MVNIQSQHQWKSTCWHLHGECCDVSYHELPGIDFRVMAGTGGCGGCVEVLVSFWRFCCALRAAARSFLNCSHYVVLERDYHVERGPAFARSWQINLAPFARQVFVRCSPEPPSTHVPWHVEVREENTQGWLEWASIRWQCWHRWEPLKTRTWQVPKPIGRFLIARPCSAMRRSIIAL